MICMKTSHLAIESRLELSAGAESQNVASCQEQDRIKCFI